MDVCIAKKTVLMPETAREVVVAFDDATALDDAIYLLETRDFGALAVGQQGGSRNLPRSTAARFGTGLEPGVW